VKLFSYVLGYGDGRNLNPRDICKIEKVRTLEDFRATGKPVAEANVEDQLVEQPTR
jgi:hypothetical protein